MFDLYVFTSGGLVLWNRIEAKAPKTIVNSFVSNRLIENAGQTDAFHKDSTTVRYELDPEFGVAFAVVHSTVIQVPHAQEVATTMKKVFLALFADELREIYAPGTNGVRAIRQSEGLDWAKFSALIELRIKELQPEVVSKGPTQPQAQARSQLQPQLVSPEPQEPDTPGTPGTPLTPGTPGSPPNAELVEEAIKKRSRRGGKKKVESPRPEEKKKSKKQMRRWGDDGMEVDEDVVLDFSGDKGEPASGDSNGGFNVDEVVEDMGQYGSFQKGEFLVNDLSEELGSILDRNGNNASATTESTGSFSFLRNYIGGKKITEQDLEKALAAIKDHLLRKNVASEAADHLCSVVEKTLLGSKTQNWTSVEATVRDAMRDALRRILTPNTSLDLLQEVQKRVKQNQGGAKGGRPYVISVVGVNGVGKSTNLSKVGFWLLQNKMKVLVAACDTFRSGAVEQLKVHVKRLDELTQRLGSGHVEIFDEGYGKDAAVIAQKAIDFAGRKGFDVVLIDTAGRRHNDERLMSSLEKFGKLAAPDKIIMVGEALVGTDSVQQARNFNAAFGTERNLDFFLISKCDTVGDMIGSMVNMTYSTGIPVLFVGVGQNYTDLRNLSVDWAVKLLMS